MRVTKKPVEVEAKQFLDVKTGAEILAWSDFKIAMIGTETDNGWIPRLEIDTLEGKMTAHPGDWIIKGVKGEFYPCKPDIFNATYDR